MIFKRYDIINNCLREQKSGDLVWICDLQFLINDVFVEYEEDLAAAIKTGLLEDKEISAIQATVKNLKERLKVETAV